MRKIGLLIALIGGLMATTAHAQELAEFVRAYPREKSIVVEYDLAVDADQVRLFVSLDGGATYRGPLQQVSGDVNRVRAGYGRCILWDVLRELETDSFDSDQVRFKMNLVLKERWPKENFVTLNAAYMPYPQWSMGFSVGQVRRFGWFVSVMTNGNLSGFSASGVCDQNGFTSGGYLPCYTGEVTKTRLSVTGGGLMRISGPWIARVGVGYGNRALCWEVENGSWMRNEGFSIAGLEVSAGVQLHWKGIALSAEVVTTQFRNVEGKIGVGICF